MKIKILTGLMFVMGIVLISACTPGVSSAEAAREVLTEQVEMVETEVEPDTSENVEEAAEETPETIDLDALLEKSPQEVADYLTERVWADIQPGWIHITTIAKLDSDQENLGVLPHGMAIPLNQENHKWVLIDEYCRVLKQVYIQKNEDGEVVQASSASENKGWSFLEESISGNAISEWSTYVFVRPDYNLQKELDHFANFGIEPCLEKVILEEGPDAIGFHFTETDFPPEGIKFINFELKVVDAETGKFISYSKEFTFEDGSKRLYEYYEIRFTQEEPDEEVLKFLSKVE